MVDYNISAVTRRVVFNGSAGVGPYAFTFEILEQTDIAVYQNSVLLTLTTDYTVTINANGTGSITLVVAATGADTVTIIGSRAIERTTDFVTAGDLLASSLNEQLDSQIVMIQQLAEENKRTMKAPSYDPADVADGGTANLTLPAAADRANLVMAFDASGNPIATEEIGDWKGNWATATTYAKRDIVKDASNNNVYRANTAHTSSGSAPISGNADTAKWDLVVDAATTAASASAAATSESNAATSASSASTSASNASTSASSAASSASSAGSAQAAAESARDSALSAYDNFDDRYLGPKASDPTLDNDGEALVVGAIYFNTTAGAMQVYTGSAWVAAYVSGSGFLSASNNLSEVSSTSSARTNLGLGSLATLSAVTNSELASGSAVANIGYTPVNIAGDTMSGALTVNGNVSIESSGGGSVTIAAASTASDFTATLQSATGTIPVVVPGTLGNVLTSDGTNWTSAAASGTSGTEPGDTLVTARVLSGPEYITAAGTYLKTDYPLIGSLASLVTSGSSWTAVTLSGGSFYSVAYGNGVWIAVGSGGTMTRSTNDGVTWTAVTSGFGTGYINSVAYGNGVWIAVGEDGVMRRSTNDGVTWSAVTSGFGTGYINSVAYGNGVWIAVGQVGLMTRSTNNGVTWTAVTSGFGTTIILEVAYDNGVWIAVGSTGKMTRSTNDGATWTAVTSGFGPSQSINSVAYGNGVWIAGGSSGAITRSTDDGVTWSPVNSGFGTATIESVAYGNGVWIAVGSSGVMIRSTNDGVTWSALTSMVGPSTMYSVAYSNGVWIAAATNAIIIRAPDSAATLFYVPHNLVNLYTGEAP